MKALKKYTFTRTDTGTIHIIDVIWKQDSVRTTLCQIFVTEKDTFTGDIVFSHGKLCLRCITEMSKRVMRFKRPYYKALLIFLATFTTKD